MEEKPYYEQEYRGPKSAVPVPKFGQVFKLLFTAPFKWNARSTRTGFWISFAITYVMDIILGVVCFASIMAMILASSSDPNISETTVVTWKIIGIVGVIISIVLAIWINLGQLAFTIRRLHDTNHTGWWYWITFVPFGQFVMLYFMVIPTVEKPVRWGGYLFKEKK